MKTIKKTVEVVDSFTLKALIHSWRVDQDGYDIPEYFVDLQDYDTRDVFTLPVNKEFLNQLQAGVNQIIEMEIKFIERK